MGMRKSAIKTNRAARALSENGMGKVYRYDSPVGRLEITLSEDVLQRIDLGGSGQDQLPKAHPLRRALDGYFDGKGDLRGLKVDPDVGEFTKRVLGVCAMIPRGEVRTYSWIARKIGSPRAARAVGNALGKNPIPIVIPCHRVVATDGLGGYGGGLGMKTRLLEIEGFEL